MKRSLDRSLLVAACLLILVARAPLALGYDDGKPSDSKAAPPPPPAIPIPAPLDPQGDSPPCISIYRIPGNGPFPWDYPEICVWPDGAVLYAERMPHERSPRGELPEFAIGRITLEDFAALSQRVAGSGLENVKDQCTLVPDAKSTRLSAKTGGVSFIAQWTEHIDRMWLGTRSNTPEFLAMTQAWFTCRVALAAVPIERDAAATQKLQVEQKFRGCKLDKGLFPLPPVQLAEDPAAKSDVALYLLREALRGDKLSTVVEMVVWKDGVVIYNPSQPSERPIRYAVGRIATADLESLVRTCENAGLAKVTSKSFSLANVSDRRTLSLFVARTEAGTAKAGTDAPDKPIHVSWDETVERFGLGKPGLTPEFRSDFRAFAFGWLECRIALASVPIQLDEPATRKLAAEKSFRGCNPLEPSFVGGVIKGAGGKGR